MDASASAAGRMGMALAMWALMGGRVTSRALEKQGVTGIERIKTG
jgi:hypothetical protein